MQGIDERVIWFFIGDVDARRTILALFVVLFVANPLRAASDLENYKIDVGDHDRVFHLYVPPGMPEGKPAPLVMVFHGGEGHGTQMVHFAHFQPLANRDHFLVAYPDGRDKRWRDGRSIGGDFNKIDDVAFVRKMVDGIDHKYPLDHKRIYATGISNGGIFSHYLAANASDLIAAAASVCGGISKPFDQAFAPKEPVSILMIQGTKDPLVPYHGGGVAGGRRGEVIDTDDATSKWAAANGCNSTSTSRAMADTDPNDKCHVIVHKWAGGRNGTEVVLYEIDGGGHTWPGGSQYLPQFMVGRVCRDFDATEVIWDFFKGHPKP